MISINSIIHLQEIIAQVLTKRIIIGITILIIGLGPIAHAQISLEGLDLGANIDAWYAQATSSKPAPYLQGMEYKLEGQTIDQHQFYRSLSWVEGDLGFAGHKFKNAIILYNIYEDVVIALNFGIQTERVPAILINQSKIDSFSIYNTDFINLINRPVPPAGQGIYEIYFRGKIITVYQKHRKEFDRFSSGVNYRYGGKLYLQYNENYHTIDRKRDLYGVFPEHKALLKDYARKESVQISRNRVTGLKEMLNYCDEIIRQ